MWTWDLLLHKIGITAHLQNNDMGENVAYEPEVWQQG